MLFLFNSCFLTCRFISTCYNICTAVFRGKERATTANKKVYTDWLFWLCFCYLFQFVFSHFNLSYFFCSTQSFCSYIQFLLTKNTFLVVDRWSWWWWCFQDELRLMISVQDDKKINGKNLRARVHQLNDSFAMIVNHFCSCFSRENQRYSKKQRWTSTSKD